MRIGIITHNYPSNSLERKDAGIFLHDFAQELALNNEVFILAPNFPGKKEKYKKTPVTWFQWAGGNKKLGNLNILNPISIIQFISLLWSGSRASVQFANKNKLDLLVGAWAFPSGFFAYWANSKTRIPYVTWSLGSDINKYVKMPILRQITLLALNRATLRCANSYALCKEVTALTAKECLFLPAITDLHTSIRKSKKKNNELTFLYVGRLEKVKGTDILIQAAKHLPKHKKWQIRIGGDGAMEKVLKRTVSESELDKRVTFLGRLDAHAVMNEMSHADYLVVPSRSESLPLVIIEAARFRLPVIASDVGDCKRVITEYNIGAVFEKENVLKLTNVMKQFIDKTRKSKIYIPGMKKMTTDFNQRNAVKTFINYVKK